MSTAFWSLWFWAILEHFFSSLDHRPIFLGPLVIALWMQALHRWRPCLGSSPVRRLWSVCWGECFGFPLFHRCFSNYSSTCSNCYLLAAVCLCLSLCCPGKSLVFGPVRGSVVFIGRIPVLYCSDYLWLFFKPLRFSPFVSSLLNTVVWVALVCFFFWGFS